MRAERGELVGGLPTPMKRRERLVPGPENPLGHGQAHGAQPDEPDLHIDPHAAPVSHDVIGQQARSAPFGAILPARRPCSCCRRCIALFLPRFGPGVVAGLLDVLLT